MANFFDSKLRKAYKATALSYVFVKDLVFDDLEQFQKELFEIEGDTAQLAFMLDKVIVDPKGETYNDLVGLTPEQLEEKLGSIEIRQMLRAVWEVYKHGGKPRLSSVT